MSPKPKKMKRWTAKRKCEAVLEILKNGTSLDDMSRQTGQPAHVLSGWRDDFLEKAPALFKDSETSAEKAKDQAIEKLKRKVGEQTMEVDLLYEKIRRMENGIPFHLWKLKE